MKVYKMYYVKKLWWKKKIEGLADIGIGETLGFMYTFQLCLESTYDDLLQK